MEKLIELLNEYEEKEGYHKAEWKVSENNELHYKYVVSDTPNGKGFSEKYLSRDVSQAYLISYRYRFIKWLVENDKIDLWSNTFTEKEERYFGEQPDFTFQSVKYTHLLMLLSISSSPIDDLISYLK